MASPFHNNNDIHQVSCDGCQSKTINGERYKCLQCNDYDLCGTCFEEGCTSKQHATGHAMVHFKVPNELFGQNILNSDITLSKMKEYFANQKHFNLCDGCGRRIVGARFKCDTCHDYDLCSTCFDRHVLTKTHENTHPMILTSPTQLPKIDMNDIHMSNVLGKGAFGQVCKATWLSKNREVACKTITVKPGDSKSEESFRQELAAYRELDGTYILKLFGYGERLRNIVKELYLITELMTHGSLKELIEHSNQDISLRRKLYLAYHIATGMRKLHAHGWIHRDIRPDNILVSSNFLAKIGDMGIARVFNPHEQQTLLGCIPFMPPEFYSRQYDQSLDVFTYSLTLNELFTEKRHHFNLFNKQIKLTAKSPILGRLIERCRASQPRQRLTAAEIKTALSNYKQASDKYISDKYPNYSSVSTKSKNDIMIKFYADYNANGNAGVRSPRISSPPPRNQGELADRYFMDMMQQFDDFCQAQKNPSRSIQRYPQFDAILKYCEQSSDGEDDHPEFQEIKDEQLDEFDDNSSYLLL